jgi:hypothetical protein
MVKGGRCTLADVAPVPNASTRTLCTLTTLRTRQGTQQAHAHGTSAMRGRMHTAAAALYSGACTRTSSPKRHTGWPSSRSRCFTCSGSVGTTMRRARRSASICPSQKKMKKQSAHARIRNCAPVQGYSERHPLHAINAARTSMACTAMGGGGGGASRQLSKKAPDPNMLSRTTTPPRVPAPEHQAPPHT